MVATKPSFIAQILAMVCGLVAFNAVASERSIVYMNGRGKSIYLNKDGAVIDGGFYRAKACSTKTFYCVEYGRIFSILAPVDCKYSLDYDVWRVGNLHAVVMAVFPHEESKILLSTNREGRVSYVYDAKNGVTGLYYDPNRFIGRKGDWMKSSGVNLDNVYYKAFGDGHLFQCRAEIG
jgi:hypothetical protein